MATRAPNEETALIPPPSPCSSLECDESGEIDQQDIVVGNEANNDKRRFGVITMALLLLLLVLVSPFAVFRKSSMTQSPPTGEEQQTLTQNAPPLLKSSHSDDKFHSFPPDFVWGAATSAYQIEGGVDSRGVSIWDTFSHIPGNILNDDTGDVACDHYHRVLEDVKLIASLGLRAYRFSIAWTRILPDGKASSPINQEGVDFYNALIDALLEHNIVPWVTLYHWDLPQALQDEYDGWLDRRVVQDFGEYADLCFQLFGDRVKHWITINEAWTASVLGYNSALHAPGHYKHPETETYIAGHHFLLAHARAVQIYRQKYQASQGGQIGICNNGDYRYPLDPNNPKDVKAAQRAILFQLGWMSDPVFLGDYPPEMRERLGDRLPSFTEEEKALLVGSCDFLAFNHYTTLMATEPKVESDIAGYWGDMYVDFHEKPEWPKNSMGWSSVPSGFRNILLWISERYSTEEKKIIIYVTENGSSYDETNVETAVADVARQKYLLGYIRACAQAMERGGIQLRGYFVWSLMDNFEWSLGFERRFGIVRVDFETLERTPKGSALWYRDMIALNGRNIPRLSAEEDEP